jgi:hypothetical protein
MAAGFSDNIHTDGNLQVSGTTKLINTLEFDSSLYVNSSMGWSGTFQSMDASTLTVKNGIIIAFNK